MYILIEKIELYLKIYYFFKIIEVLILKVSIIKPKDGLSFCRNWAFMINIMIIYIHSIDNSILINNYPFLRENLVIKFSIQNIYLIEITYKSPTSNPIISKTTLLEKLIKIYFFGTK